MFTEQAWSKFISEVEVGIKGLNEQQARAAMVRDATAERDRVIQKSTARSRGIAPDYQQTVDGKRDAPIESVKPDGTIIFDWNYLGEVAQDTMDALVARSPRESGDYIRGLKMFIAGQEVPDARWAPLPHGTDMIQIAATVPYARRLEVGHARTRTAFVKQVMPHIVEETCLTARSLYGDVVAFEFGYSQLGDQYKLAEGSGSIRHRHGVTINVVAFPTITLRLK